MVVAAFFGLDGLVSVGCRKFDGWPRGLSEALGFE